MSYQVQLEMRLRTGEEKTLVEIVGESSAADQDEAAAVAIGLWEAICETIRVASIRFVRPKVRRVGGLDLFLHGSR